MSLEARVRWAHRVRRLLTVLAVVTVGMVAAMHATNPPTLDAFRVPHDLRNTASLWGLSWPASFDIYHGFLVVMFANAATLWMGIAKIADRRWWRACVAASVVGGAFAAISFFYFSLQLVSDRPFTVVEIETAVIAGVYAAVWFSVDVAALFLCFGTPVMRFLRSRFPADDGTNGFIRAS